MELQTQTFKDFFAYTRNMNPNTLLPICAYIWLKVEGGVASLEKSNLSTCCKYTFEQEGALNILLEEVEVKTFIDNIKTTEFEIVVDENITLSSGNIIVTFTAPYQVDDYPKIKNEEGEKQNIQTTPYLIAAKFTDQRAENWLQYVVSDENGVMGTDNFRIYYKSGVFPKTVLSVECCNIISTLSGDVTHYQTPNHDYFTNGDVIYGFNKPAFGVPNFMSVVNKIETGGFAVSKTDLLTFCDMVIPRSEHPCKMSPNGENVLRLNLIDNDKNKTSQMDITITGNAGEFKFLPKTMAALLRPLPYEIFTMSVGSALSITTPEDPTYKGILSRLTI